MLPTDVSAATRGEEFREDLRGVACGPGIDAAATAAPQAAASAPAGGARGRASAQLRRALPAEVLARLTRLSPWRSTLAVLQTGALIALTLTLAWQLFAWWAVVPALIIIGTQQHALFVLAHDAAHYRLYETRWLNDLVGRTVGTLGGVSMMSYRVIHRLHHNALYSEVDPDIALHGGYPRGKAYLAKKLAKDLAGLTALKTFGYFFGNPAINGQTRRAQRPLDDTSANLREAARSDRWGVVVFHLGMPLALLLFAGPLALAKFLVLWTLPLVTILQPILRLRAICEHGAVTDLSTPLTAARTNIAGPLARWLLFPHHVNYHVEHHLYPAVPHYRLPELHRELKARGVLDAAEVRPLRQTLGRVFAPRVATATAPAG